MSSAMRLDRVDWRALVEDLDRDGCAVVPSLLSGIACAEMIRLYSAAERFRKTIVMSRHGYGQGEYRYFSYPLPDEVGRLRERFYEHLAPIARTWNERLRLDGDFPDTLQAFLDVCHRHGQERPTPLLLKYAPGDFNRLHQDVYGEIGFPLQLAVCLNEPGADFSGGEFVVTEQRARMQSRVQVVPLGLGDGVVFANRYRPVRSTRGFSRAAFRHGVSRLHRGARYSLGVIFHDAT